DVAARDVCPGLDRPHRVSPIVVGQEPAKTVEVWIQRRVVASGIDDVRIPSVRIRVPDLDERPPDRAKICIDNPSLDDDSLSCGARPSGRDAREVVLAGTEGGAGWMRRKRVVRVVWNPV